MARGLTIGLSIGLCLCDITFVVSVVHVSGEVMECWTRGQCECGFKILYVGLFHACINVVSNGDG